jgi:hypothetical protein
MSVALEIDPGKFSQRSLRLILSKAQEWECLPGEAIARLLDRLAERAVSRSTPTHPNPTPTEKKP